MRRGELGGRNLLKFFFVGRSFGFVVGGTCCGEGTFVRECVMVSVHFRDT